MQALPTFTKEETIQLRGFVYITADGRTILADQPDLKSCCVGAAHTQESQVELLGEIVGDLQKGAVTLEGIWMKDRPPYQLRDVKVLSSEMSVFGTGLVLLLGIAVGSYLWKRFCI